MADFWSVKELQSYKTEHRTALAMLNLKEVGLFFLKEPLQLLLGFINTLQSGASLNCAELIINSDILWLQEATAGRDWGGSNTLLVVEDAWFHLDCISHLSLRTTEVGPKWSKDVTVFNCKQKWDVDVSTLWDWGTQRISMLLGW